jgi:hypothetical protein
MGGRGCFTRNTKPMAGTFSSREAKKSSCRSFCCQYQRASQAIISICLVLVILSSASAQTASDKSRNLQQKLKPAPTLVADPLPEVDPAPISPPVLTPEQLPPRAPTVAWDGKQLSITSENSTLADILAAVRGRTQASIDIPPGASAERVAAQLGPGPAREVLTSLLSGSNFNYIILASDADEDAIQSVLLTPRGKVDDAATGAVVAAATGVRRPPGYPDLSHRVVPDAPSESGSENSSSEPPAVVQAGALSGYPVSEPMAGASETVQPQGDIGSQTAVPDATPADGAMPAGISSPAALAVGGSQATTANPGQPPTSTPQMVQELQRMYQQRRQIQVQQNQGNSPPAN